MKDWKACIRTWERKEKQKGNGKGTPKVTTIYQAQILDKTQMAARAIARKQGASNGEINDGACARGIGNNGPIEP